ncbi:glycosyltransferase family 2 protein [Paenibacillus pini]|uniref:Glycosyltransferase n=1 Tax=Paenibacillus pini JCM 16418 TaxID=1236976 RepID=W7YVP4_9BACL|nr:glycosyltransferase [Paenibacillus pini]GAF08671.1 glycosyltransferase [Paenibacillus pini JCM 16418]
MSRPILRRSRSHVRSKMKKRKVPTVQVTVNSTEPVVSIIIPAMNEERTIADVIKQARLVHSEQEVIVVANGCTDRTATIAASMGATVIWHEQALGHDVGRTVGTQAAKGSVLLYLDGDMRIAAKHLRPFVNAVLSGTDVALNRYSGPVQQTKAHPVVLAKHVLNTMLARSDLKGASMTAVPHALSRHAVDTLGAECLSVPPVALAKATTSGLIIETVHEVSVGRMNRKRRKLGEIDPLQPLVIQDHLQALQWVISQNGPRCGYTDLGRQRNRVGR